MSNIGNSTERLRFTRDYLTNLLTDRTEGTQPDDIIELLNLSGSLARDQSPYQFFNISASFEGLHFYGSVVFSCVVVIPKGSPCVFWVPKSIFQISPAGGLMSSWSSVKLVRSERWSQHLETTGSVM